MVMTTAIIATTMNFLLLKMIKKGKNADTADLLIIRFVNDMKLCQK